MKVCVLGGGSFGTALANTLADNGHDVWMYLRDQAVRADIEGEHYNSRYLPGVPLNPSLRTTGELAEAVGGAPVVISAIPSHSTRDVLEQARPHLLDEAIVVSVSKGMELGSLAFMSEVVAQAVPAHRAAFLSGPNFARELALRLPSAATVASAHAEAAEQVQAVFSSPYYRIYTSDDVVGLEVAGAVKNVMAIAAGISDGLELGHNTRAALITRGLAEMARMGVALGGRQETFMGLSGMGDLVLTCTGDLSRNRSVGLAIGRGKTLDEILAGMHQVAEGVRTTRAVKGLAERIGVEMPIVEQVYKALYEGKDARQAVTDLMVRKARRENAPAPARGAGAEHR